MLGSAALSGSGSSILGVSRLIIAYPVGWLTDRYGRKAGLMLGLVLTLIGTLVLGVAMLVGSFPLVVVGLVIFGLGVGAGQQLRLAAADMFVPARRGEGLGYVLTGSLIGAVAAPLLIWGGELLADADRTRTASRRSGSCCRSSSCRACCWCCWCGPIRRRSPRIWRATTPGYVEPDRRPTPCTAGSGLGDLAAPLPAGDGVRQQLRRPRHDVDDDGDDLAGAGPPRLRAVADLGVGLAARGRDVRLLDPVRPAERPHRTAQRDAARQRSSSRSARSWSPTSPDYLVITPGTFLVGLGWSCVNVSTSALITEVVEPAERGRAIGLSDTISQAATIVMPLAGGPLVEWAGLPALAVVALADAWPCR